MSEKKEPLKQLRTNLLTRGLSMAKASFKAGSLMLKPNQTPNAAWLSQIENLVGEMGRLKGTAMKVGQSLSMYGEHLLPKEVNDLLKKLQTDSPPLAWSALEPVVLAELGREKLNELEIDPVSIASASIGQVHRAKIKSTGETLALKIQYPGVDKAVDSDLRLLKFILNLSNVVPRGPQYDQVFAEIRQMFQQEIDYTLELKNLKQFGDLVGRDERYIIPKTFDRYCSPKVLAMEYVTGDRADSAKVQSLSQERRNGLGRAFLELYLRELSEFKLMQTDPHLGNYLVKVDETGENDKLILFDFGAVREVPDSFLRSYRHLIHGGFKGDGKMLLRGGRELGLVQPGDSEVLQQKYVDLCLLMTEPFETDRQPYNWGESDLPKRVAAKATDLAFSHRLRAPPPELVFLDRKLGGVFIFLSVLKCVMPSRELIENMMTKVG